jgi:hypothetical protein
MWDSMKISGPICLFTLAWLFALNAVAHHSGAMFDDKKALAIAGTVRVFQWSNPHCWIQVLVPGQPAPTEWSIEMGSPSLLVRGGWNPSSLKAGDKINVVIRPLRDGTSGGLFVSATRDDGGPIVAASDSASGHN